MTRCLASSISRAPVPYDPDQAKDVASALPEPLTKGAVGDLVHGVAGSSPFLAQLLVKYGAWLADEASEPMGGMLERLVSQTTETCASSDWRGLCAALRHARARAALYIALADLGGAWELNRITGALTELADSLTGIALGWLLDGEIARDRIPGIGPQDSHDRVGLFILGMGKLGARELNYSSDIDLICLFDQDRFRKEDVDDVRARCIHVIRRLVKALSERTSDGYVFRTDLRLRPAPSTTPPCMSIEAAEGYYENSGRTWERAAHIKARPIAGNLATGNTYLRRIAPFIWRRSLDFAAIEDIEEILRKIRTKQGHFTPTSVPGCNIKLSPGGIREIELFAQTRQLIMGGRLPVLREPTTLGALSALRDEGIIGAGMCASLSEAYVAHRTVEHRLQMVSDSQTQTIPESDEARARVAALDGWSDHRAWENAIAERLATVNEVTGSFFDAGTPERTETATIQIDEANIAALGFGEPQEVCRTISRWRSGAINATGTERAQRLYASLEAELINLLGRADSPDSAIAEFDRFISGLPSGVQVFSLFRANRHLLELVIDIFSTAPRLAGHLGRHPQTMDALLSEDFFEKVPSLEWLEADLQIWIGDTTDYERVLDMARAWARELNFRIGVQVLLGMADEIDAGKAFSGVAEAVLTGLLPFVVEHFSARYGPPPGRGITVVAMGKLGTREMTTRSDLDLITVYDAGDAAQSAGPRPLPSQTYFARLTQSLVTALTAVTSQGRLYSVDMRLRPSGRKGPVAVSLAAFEEYQTRQAWVWEHLALTRGRPVAGDPGLAADAARVIATALSQRRGDPRVMEEAREMRSRLLQAYRDDRTNPWSLKHSSGGLMEIEFLAQTGGLLHGLGHGRSARDTLVPLAKTGWISSGEAKELTAALMLQTRLLQIDCVAQERPFDPGTAGERLRRTLAKLTGEEDFESLVRSLRNSQTAAASICGRLLDGGPGNGTESQSYSGNAPKRL